MDKGWSLALLAFEAFPVPIGEMKATLPFSLVYKVTIQLRSLYFRTFKTIPLIFSPIGLI